MAAIAAKQAFVMSLFLGEFLHNMQDKAIFILRHIHFVEVIPQEFSYGTDFLGRNHHTLGNAGLACFALLAEHVDKLGVGGLNGCTAIFDGDFLVADKSCHHIGNVDFLPAKGHSLIFALDICHSCRQLAIGLHLQIFLNLGGCPAVGVFTDEEIVLPFQDSSNVCLRVGILANKIQLAVDVGHQILQSLT